LLKSLEILDLEKNQVKSLPESIEILKQRGLIIYK